MKLRLAPAVALLAAGSLAVAQGNPRGATSVNIAGKKVSIDYGRPALKGRSLDDLTKQLPADRMWRAGENQVTTLTTETALSIGGKTVAPGKYSLYVHAPATGDWSLAVNSDNGVALGKIYDKAPENMKNEPWPYLQDYTGKIGAKEVARAPMKSGTGAAADQFTMTLSPAPEGATLGLAWGDRTWAVGIKAAK